MKTIKIDFDEFECIKDFHLWLKEQCDFPEYYGCNLDAMYDCLSENPSFLFQIKDKEYTEYESMIIQVIEDSGCQIM